MPTYPPLAHRMRRGTLKCWRLPAPLVSAAASPPQLEVGSPWGPPASIHLLCGHWGLSGETRRTPRQLAWEEEGRSGHHPPGGVTSALILFPVTLRSRELLAPALLSPSRRLVMCLTLSLPSACCAAPSAQPYICVQPTPVPPSMLLLTFLCYPFAPADRCSAMPAAASWGPAMCFAREALEPPHRVPLGPARICRPCMRVGLGQEACQMPGAHLGFGASLVHFPPWCQASSSASRSPLPSSLSATTGVAFLLPPSVPSSSVSWPSGTRMKVLLAGWEA